MTDEEKKKEEIAYFKIDTIPFDNTYQAPIGLYLFVKGRYTEVMGEEDIEFFRENHRFKEKKRVLNGTVRGTTNTNNNAPKAKGKGKGKGAKGDKKDDKSEAEKKGDKTEGKPKDDNPLENI